MFFCLFVGHEGDDGQEQTLLAAFPSFFFLAFVAGWAFTSVFEFVFNIPAIASIGGIKDFTGGVVYRFFRNFTPLDLLLSF